MASSSNNQDANFNDMSVEELEAFIDAQSVPSVDSKEEAQSDSDNSTDSDNSDDKQASDEPDLADSESENSTDAPTAINPYANKSAEQLIKIIKDKDTFVGRQANEIGALRKQVDDLAKTKNQPFETKLSEEYDTDQIDTVKKIAEMTYEELKKRESDEQVKLRESAKQSNSSAFNAYKDNPLFQQKIEPILTAELQSNPNIVYEQDWIERRTKEVLFDLASSGTMDSQNGNGKALIEKKRAVGGAVSSGSRPVKTTKSVSEMSAEEYAEYAKIPRI